MKNTKLTIHKIAAVSIGRRLPDPLGRRVNNSFRQGAALGDCPQSREHFGNLNAWGRVRDIRREHAARKEPSPV